MRNKKNFVSEEILLTSNVYIYLLRERERERVYIYI